ncbi:MAG: transcriptional repressor [Verrucomicrobiales bacterium]|jgi:Fur family ferric uptake transcriptional regulator|nr:transcriptional repressor [Verrucomicrobiales bacterium]MBP9222232.1 transcriptional repressor [Verrucomicrobiales bacterium]
MNPEIKERLDRYIQQKGMRRTGQRDIIVEAAFSNDDHFTAEELFAKARRLDPKTSRATLYRTIALLVECKLLKEIDLGRDERVYDPNFLDSPDHNHLICVDCGKVLEFEDDNTAALIDAITRRLGFRPSSKSMRIEACCDRLRTEGRCETLIKMRLEKQV